MKYTISFTEKQLTTLARGLEFYSRFLAGQWEIPDMMEFQEYENQDKINEFWDIRNEVNEEFVKLKSKFTNLSPNESYAIGSSKLSEDAKISYDIYRPVWEEFSKEYNELHPEESRYSVYDFPGLTYSKEGRIKIETNKL